MKRSSWAKRWGKSWKNSWGQVDEQSKAGATKGKKRFPAWHWMPPLEPLRRPRKKKEAELVAFLNT